MSPENAVDLFREALFLIMMGVAVIIVPSLLVGLVVSVFQAATSINEQTMSFLPRLMMTMTTILVAGPWMLKMMLEFTHNLLIDIPNLIG